MDNIEKFSSIVEEMKNTYIKKNHDYGSSFDQSCNEFGMVAGIVRISDKFNRLKTLSKKQAEVQDESIIDTITDMANYCILLRMWMESEKETIPNSVQLLKD